MKMFLRKVLFIGVCLLLSCDFSNLRTSHHSVFTEEDLLRADSRHLQSTVISPHLEEPIGPGTNVLWCSTFQLVWNEVCELVGEELHFDQDPPMVAIL
ncbi:MAG: hypothetical protein ACYSUX_16840, partial [Planctomycetota bacterium]